MKVVGSLDGASLWSGDGWDDVMFVELDFILDRMLRAVRIAPQGSTFEP